MRKHIKIEQNTLIAIIVSVVVAVIAPYAWSGVIKTFVVWNAALLTFLVLTWRRMVLTHPCSHVTMTGQGYLFIMGAVVACACASLLAIVLIFPHASHLPHTLVIWHTALASMTILLAWLLIHTTFTLHYALDYYKIYESSGKLPLEFPQTPQPDYWDFLYFAFVIGIAGQVSDVIVAHSALRRMVLIHSILAFFFNTSLLALTINMLASLL